MLIGLVSAAYVDVYVGGNVIFERNIYNILDCYRTELLTGWRRKKRDANALEYLNNGLSKSTVKAAILEFTEITSLQVSPPYGALLKLLDGLSL